MNNLIEQIDKYYNEFLNQDMDASHIGDTVIDTGYALDGITLFINFIKDREKE